MRTCMRRTRKQAVCASDTSAALMSAVWSLLCAAAASSTSSVVRCAIFRYEREYILQPSSTAT